MPKQEQVVLDTFQKYADKLKSPLKLADILENAVGENSQYAAVFIPSGHGVLAKIPHNLDVKKVLNWAVEQEKFIIALCHGPASLGCGSR